MSISDLPLLNASLNAVASGLLLAGAWAGRTHRAELHKKIMGAALLVSAAFLTSYLIYHFNTAAVTRYAGEGPKRSLYFFILFTHIPLATLMLPGIGLAVWKGVQGQVDQHRRLVRWVWPVWMYVSVTGVLIYLMLYVWQH